MHNFPFNTHTAVNTSPSHYNYNIPPTLLCAADLCLSVPVSHYVAILLSVFSVCICCFIQHFSSPERRSFCPLPRHPCGFNQFTRVAAKSLLSFWLWPISAEAISTGHIRQFSAVPRTNRLIRSQTGENRNISPCSKALCSWWNNSMFLKKKGEVFTQRESHPPFKRVADNAATSKEFRITMLECSKVQKLFAWKMNKRM